MIYKMNAAIAAMLILSACGAGGGSDSNDDVLVGLENTDPSIGTYTEISDDTATETSALTFVAVTNTGDTSSGSTGVLDHSDGTISAGVLEGTFNADRTIITLADGGTATVTNPATTEFLRVFSLESTSENLFGVVGLPTILADMPDSGSAFYVGDIELNANDGSDTYELTGDVLITTEWADNTVRSEFDNLSGTRNASETVSNVGTIIVTDAALSDSSFSGGSATGTGTPFETLDATDLSDDTLGQFYGPNADEVGGVLVISTDDLEVIGVYTAE